MQLQTLSICVLFFLAYVDASTVHSQKKLRSAAKDVDTDDDNDDDDSDVGVPAPAVAVAPAAVVAAAPVSGAAPAPSVEVAENTAVQMHEMMEQAEEMFEDHNVSDPRNKHKEELAGLMYIENVYEEKLDDLEDENYAKEIEKEEVPVANETSPGLANMLGEMREEMHQYAIPFYKKFLKEKIKEAQDQQKKLVTEIAEDQGVKEEAKVEEPVATPKPVESKPSTHKKITTNNMMYALALVVVLATIAFFLSRRSSR